MINYKKISFPITIVVIVTTVFIAFLIYGVLNEVSVSNSKTSLDFSPTSAEKTICVRHGDDNVYVQGYAEIKDSSGLPGVAYDECIGKQVVKIWCSENPPDSGNFTTDRKIFDCGPFGCENGACKRSLDSLSATFEYPYLITWMEEDQLVWFFPVIPASDKQEIEFSLEGVALGKIMVPDGFARYDGGAAYKIGEEVNALVLKLKISNMGNAITCPKLNIRMIKNEIGDTILPNTEQFQFPGVEGCQMKPNSTYNGIEVAFTVPENQKEFLLTTGGSSNIFFSVSVKNGVLEVKNISADKEG